MKEQKEYRGWRDLGRENGGRRRGRRTWTNRRQGKRRTGKGGRDEGRGRK